MAEEILRVEHLKKSFGDERVLQDVSFSLHEGELISILGKSGVGKSTLFSLIAGLHTPDDGSVFLRGEEVTGKPGYVGYMLQKDLLLPFRSVEDNVILPMVLKGTDQNEARKKASPYYEIFGLEGTQKKWPSQLSGGMRQRAALLRTFLFDADVMLLDEPFSALDAMTRAGMHDWYLGVMEEIRHSALFITHDVDEALMLSDRILLLTHDAEAPGAVISAEVTIDVPRPRTQAFSLTKEYMSCKAEILEKMGG